MGKEESEGVCPQAVDGERATEETPEQASASPTHTSEGPEKVVREVPREMGA